MFRKALRLLSLVLIIAVLGVSMASAGNMLANWSFENPETTLWQINAPGDPVPGRFTWDVTAGNIWLVNGATNGAYVTTAYEGAQFVQFNLGSWMTQTLNTTPGQTYKVKFAATGAVNVPNQTHSMIVIWRSGEENTFFQEYSFNKSNSPENPMWETFEFDVVAGSTSDFIGFGGSGMYPWVDAVSVEPVPEPASLAVLLTGLIGMAGFRRRMK